jgi:hypothetical protein
MSAVKPAFAEASAFAEATADKTADKTAGPPKLMHKFTNSEGGPSSRQSG